MGFIGSSLGLALSAFASTNVDYFVLLLLFFSQPHFHPRNVVIGHYLGVAILFAVSTITFFASLVIPVEWMRFLGIIPFLLGINLLWHQIRGTSEVEESIEERAEELVAAASSAPARLDFERYGLWGKLLGREQSLVEVDGSGALVVGRRGQLRTVWATVLGGEVLAVTAATLADGGDNISVYGSLFANIEFAKLLTIVCISLTLTGILCLITSRLVNTVMVAERVRRYGLRLAPFVLMGLGMFLLLRPD